MNFSPYHAFGGCTQLERTVRNLNAAGNVPSPVLRAFDVYHYSLIHKMRSACYHVDTLRNYLASQNATPPPPEELFYRVNFHLEGFLYLVGSAGDIFAREMLIYFGIQLPKQVYFDSAHKEIKANRPGDPVLPLIAVPSWRPQFGDYRNTSTHERLIATAYRIEVTVQGSTHGQRLRFELPDDPRASTRTYRQRIDLVDYCERAFKRHLSLFNKAYKHVAARAQIHQHLPL